MTIIRDERYNKTVPDDLFPDVFRVCCKQLEVEELEAIHPQKSQECPEREGKNSPDTVFELAFLAIQVLGSPRMQQNTLDHDRFGSVLITHWPGLFCGLTKYHDLLSGRKPGSKGDPMLCNLLGAVIVAVLDNVALRQLLAIDIELQAFVWMLWLDGGPPDFKHSIFSYSSVARAVAIMAGEFGFRNPTLFPICMVICDSFGGKDAVAEIALLSAFRTMMTKDLSIILRDLHSHTAVLLVLQNDPNQQIAKKICELDGVAKLIEGVTTMVRGVAKRRVRRTHEHHHGQNHSHYRATCNRKYRARRKGRAQRHHSNACRDGSK